MLTRDESNNKQLSRMGKKGRSKNQREAARGPVKQIGSCKKFHPDTLTKRLEKKQAAQRHKRQNGFEQVIFLAHVLLHHHLSSNMELRIWAYSPQIGLYNTQWTT